MRKNTFLLLLLVGVSALGSVIYVYQDQRFSDLDKSASIMKPEDNRSMGSLKKNSTVSEFDFIKWDAILKKYVQPRTLSGVRINTVNYKKLKSDPEFKRMVERLQKFSPGSLKSKNEKLAFWINVYNIMAVKMVLDNYPVKSIKDVRSLSGSVWKKDVGVVGGKTITLHEIEHEILRKMGEPRIHAAIVCASVSCPDLCEEAYVADKLNLQLDVQMRKFLENWGKGMKVDTEGGKVYLSKIFSWFEDDFKPQGGVLKFVSKYAPARDQKALKSGKLKISYLDYDWDLNEP